MSRVSGDEKGRKSVWTNSDKTTDTHITGMSLEQEGERDGESAAERLAELTGRPVEEFEYDDEIPDAAEQDWEPADE